MTFEKWASEYAECLEPGCGRHRDMREAWNAGQEEMRERAAKKANTIFPAMPSISLGISALPLEGTDEQGD